jgi:hypothetical protein
VGLLRIAPHSLTRRSATSRFPLFVFLLSQFSAFPQLYVVLRIFNRLTPRYHGPLYDDDAHNAIGRDSGRAEGPSARHFTSHESQVTSHELLIETERLDSTHRSSRPKTFSPSNAVLDFAQQFCSEEYFSATTADRWNFGLCATIPREPRQARKGATVTGQLRVPRNTRSSSLAPGLLRMAAQGCCYRHGKMESRRL